MPCERARSAPVSYEQAAFEVSPPRPVPTWSGGTARTVSFRLMRRGTLVGGILLVTACRGETTGTPLFELLDAKATGIAFENRLPEDTSFNILNYLYYYNGGGVAVGDVDNDGRPDLYFTANVGPGRLYRNLGGYRFEDITEKAGAGGAGGWTTGVTMADVNGDGWMDIYLSGVSYLGVRGRNVLYVNDGDGTFTDRTDEYGLAHVGYSTQALFFDYDGDGDLDMYLLNHSTHTERGVSSRPQREARHPTAGDRLFRNDAGRFTDVSAEAGIYGGVEGYGLGVVASDFDLDGCPDLFVANDFQENDFLYRNNCDGTFTESIASAMGHTSRFSMGIDAADFDNDGRPDLIVTDMLPEREEILKTSANAESFNVYNLKLQAGYHPQFARNTLQLNRGGGRFSEIAFLAGVHATDWSWAPLFADLDDDGFKDLLVTNGIYRRPNDLDYINYVGNDAVQASLARGLTRENLALIERMPQVPLANYAYRNNGNLTFTNMADEWGLGHPGFSNGAAYVDLDNTGSLDLVINNVNAPASIYRSRVREITGNHFLRVRLSGSGANTAGIGARVTIWHGDAMQMLEQMPTRGFQSSVDPRLHFGVGTSGIIDSLTIIWPDRRRQTLSRVAVDRELTLSQADAVAPDQRAPTSHVRPLFATVPDRQGLEFRHRENTFFDYNREPLMPHRLSTEGPALAVGDVNGDGLDDVYIGGAKGQAGKLFVQLVSGRFRASSGPALAADSLHEDVDALFFDADGDGDLDLYVVSGGNEYWDVHEELRDRLYTNDGSGNFTRAKDALPDVRENGSTVVAGDFSGDGRLDLFVGSRVVSRQYGVIPRSHLLRNEGGGRFSDVTDELGGALADAGMVSSATWIDYDRDGQLDLVVVGEWMPVRVFRQENGRFVDRTTEVGLANSSGWWNSVAAVDLNGDGHEDLVLGNLGLNSYIRASPTEPARLHVKDFGDNGALEQILTFHKHGVSYPLASRDELVRQIPQLRSRFPTHAAFGASRLEDIFSASELGTATVHEARVFATSIAMNDGKGAFALRPLPIEAQFAPVYATLADDFDGDGHVDLLLAGNFFGVTPVRGRYDASSGLLLRGDGAGAFRAAGPDEIGLTIDGETRAMQWLRRAGGGDWIVIARNDADLVAIQPLLRKASPPRRAGAVARSGGRR